MAVDPHTHTGHRPRSLSAVGWVAGALAVIVVLGLGLWVLGGVLPVGYVTSVVLSAVWFGVVGVAVWAVSRRLPALRRALTVTFLAVGVASAFGFYWTSIRDDTVNEVVVTGVAPAQVDPAGAGSGSGAPPPSTPRNVIAARGAFSGRAHPGEGTATIVKLGTGGTKLTLTDFATDNGPDLRVYLVKGPVNGEGDVKNPIDLGRLKGNIGNQQYTVPDGIDPAGYVVVIWCRAFSVNFAQADLTAV